MFDCCLRVSNINFPAFTDLTKVSNMVYMFAHCWALGTAEITDIVSKFYIDDNTNQIFKDYTSGNDENQNRILNGKMAILTQNYGARCVLSTYGHTDNIYLGGKGSSDVERDTDYARIVYIPQRYATAASNNEYKYVDFTSQYGTYDLFTAKDNAVSKSYKGTGTYTGDPTSDGDITVTGKWIKDDSSDYENVSGKTITITSGEFTYGTETMVRQ